MHGAAQQDETDPYLVVGRRGAARLRLAVPAKIVTVCETRPCVLLDLSRTGARISLPQSLPEGEGGFLRIAEIEVFACVVRSHEGINGLEFDRPLTDAQVISVRHYAECFEANKRRELLREVRDWVRGSH